MMIEVCVGSSCHIKGSPEIVDLLNKAIEENKLESAVTRAGSFCTGRCNRVGVTVTIDDEVYTGITPETFNEFFEDKVMKHIAEGEN